MKKHLFAALACLCAALALAVPAYGAEAPAGEDGREAGIVPRTEAREGEYQDFRWELNGAGTLKVEGSGPMPYQLKSETYHGWDPYRESINRVVLDPGITEIPDAMFRDYPNLYYAELPYGLQRIGKYAFAGCAGLDGSGVLGDGKPVLTVPSTVKILGEGAFRGCVKLSRAVIGQREEATPAPWMKIENEAFKGCTGLKELKIGNMVTSVGNYAFLECSGLERVEIAGSVKTFGQQAFYRCPGSFELSFPDGIAEIGGSAFQWCGNLTSVSIGGEGGGVIKNNAFYGCGKLERVEISGVETIGSGAFSSCGLRELTLGAPLKTISNSAFAANKDLASVEIPDSVEAVGERAFSGCGALASAALGAGVRFLGGEAFASSGLTSIRLPAGLTELEEKEYSSGDENWTEYDQFAGCSKLKEIVVEEENPAYRSIGGVLYTRDGKRLLRCPGGYQGALAAPGDVEEILACAFSGCGSLTAVTVPQGVKAVGYSTFLNCAALEEIALPEGVERIGAEAFAGCRALKTAALPRSLGRIGSQAFEGTGLDIFYAGSEADWELVEKAEDAFREPPRMHFNSSAPSVPGGAATSPQGGRTVFLKAPPAGLNKNSKVFAAAADQGRFTGAALGTVEGATVRFARNVYPGQTLFFLDENWVPLCAQMKITGE